jgi:hypothetical protein
MAALVSSVDCVGVYARGLCRNSCDRSNWRQDIVHHGARLMDFKLQAIVLVVLAAVALGPLVFFVPCLAALR